MTWILIPTNGDLVVKNDGSPVRVVICTDLRPAVVCESNYFYPSSWCGSIDQKGTVERWVYTAGPVKELMIHLDNGGDRWVMIIWR
jgi:hypothetical protein